MKRLVLSLLCKEAGSINVGQSRLKAWGIET